MEQTGYPELGKGFNRATYKLRLNALERLLRRRVALPLVSVLEGAVGVGAYAEIWGRLGAREWVGLDISSHAIQNLQRRFPKSEFHVADLTLPAVDVVLGDRSFGLVTAIDVLYHLVDEGPFARALRNLARRVCAEGYLLLSDVFCQPPEQHIATRNAAISRVLSFVAAAAGFRILGPGSSECDPRGAGGRAFAALGRGIAIQHLARDWQSSALHAAESAKSGGLGRRHLSVAVGCRAAEGRRYSRPEPRTGSLPQAS